MNKYYISKYQKEKREREDNAFIIRWLIILCAILGTIAFAVALNGTNQLI